MFGARVGGALNRKQRGPRVHLQWGGAWADPEDVIMNGARPGGGRRVEQMHWMPGGISELRRDRPIHTGHMECAASGAASSLEVIRIIS